MFPPFGRGARETSRESTETQVWIPLNIMGWLMIGGDLFIVGINTISWCFWLYRWLRLEGTLWAWCSAWWDKFSIRFPLHIAALIAWPISIPLFLLAIRFALELLDRWWPPADSKARDLGPMGPLYGLRPFFRALFSVLFSRSKIKTRYDELFGQEET